MGLHLVNVNLQDKVPRFGGNGTRSRRAGEGALPWGRKTVGRPESCLPHSTTAPVRALICDICTPDRVSMRCRTVPCRAYRSAPPSNSTCCS